MAAPHLNDLQARLDELKAGRARAPSLGDRARSLFVAQGDGLELEALQVLDADLDRAGVHTAADARLLRELSTNHGRLGELSRGLAARAEASLGQFEQVLKEAERQAGAGELAAGALSQLTDDFRRLARVVKVAAVFSAPGAVSFEIFRRATREAEPPGAPRLAVAEFYAARAGQNVEDTAQKRRDLELANELLLRLAADTKGDRERVRRLRIDVAAARQRVRSAPAVRSLTDLVQHLRHSARKDPRTAFLSLRALYDRAVEADDAALADVAQQALRQLLPAGEELGALVNQAEARRAAGLDVVGRIEANERMPAGGKAEVEAVEDLLTQLSFDLDQDEQKAMELASGCARFFDVEDTLSADYAQAEMQSARPLQRRVPYPTQNMTFEHTGSLDDVNNFVIAHPDLWLLDLASNRQPVRTYLEVEAPTRPKQVKKTAVRVYVLDASGSMHGARARFRDAILIAELNAMRVKARLKVPFDPLYFCFFNDTPTDLARVDSGSEATRRIRQLFERSPAEGQTDITLALLSAFESIRTAQGVDPYLARATVVLVTDGEDGIDQEVLKRTRKPLEGLDIALSFISLGEENPDLKALVLEQRQEGNRAFYQHLTDAEIGLAHTEFDSAWRTLLPVDAPVTADALERLLPHLEALENIAQARTDTRVPAADDQFDAFFPAAPAKAQVAPRLAQTLADLLEAVGEAAALAPADGRPGDAVAVLTHLLKLYEVPVGRYLGALGSTEPRLKAALERVRLLCRPYA